MEENRQTIRERFGENEFYGLLIYSLLQTIRELGYLYTVLLELQVSSYKTLTTIFFKSIHNKLKIVIKRVSRVHGTDL